MQATIPRGVEYGVGDEKRVRALPAAGRAGTEERDRSRDRHVPADRSRGVEGMPVQNAAASEESEGWRARIAEFPWLVMSSGLLAGLALAGRLRLGLSGWSGPGLGVLALGLGVLAFRRLRVRRASERAHWGAQLGRLVQSLGKSDDGVLVLDGAKRVLWAGHGYCRLAGKSPAELVGRLFDPLHWATSRTEDQENLAEVVRAGGVWRGELANPGTQGGARSTEQWVFGVRGLDGGIGHYVGIRREVHASASPTEELETANETLQRRLLQVTSEFGQFKRELEMMAFALGHQLRSAQIGLTEMKAVLGMERLDSIPANVRREVDWMMRSGARTIRLVESLGWLHELKRKPLEPERVDMSVIASEILDGFSEVEPGRSIRTSVEPRMWVVGDARLLRVMLANLLGNAWKYSRANPNARIEFGRAAGLGNGGTFFVRDNGIGLDRSWVGKVLGGGDFSAYLEASSDARLGLVTVQRIAERHRGEVWAEPQSGGGVEFRFSLG